MNEISTKAARHPQGEQREATVWPVLLSGGAGKRLWPMSRKHYPKQLLPLLTERSMLQETAGRIAGLPGMARPIAVCHHEHRFLVEEQLEAIGIDPGWIVLEPVGRNTAPALVVAALLVVQENPEGLILALPSDHHVRDVEAFHEAVRHATAAARRGRLVTFGATPTRAETGYGYIEGADALPDAGGALAVAHFLEKPDAGTAAKLVESGRYFWNSGMFLLPAKTFLDEVERWQPELLASCRQAIENGRQDLHFFRLDEAAFASAPNISVDKAVMEVSDKVAVLPVEIGWSDIGSWYALHEALRALGPSDDSGNVLTGDVEIDDVHNCHIQADGRLVAAVGVSDLTVVVTDDVTLVARSDQASRVDAIVERLGRRNRQEVLEHSTVYRPWGSYQSVDAGERFQVKRIVVKPGAQLSLQMHHHRAEHWVVVRGTARIHCDGTEKLLHENQSTYIPPGSTHRLANPGLMPLHLIEVQSGSYLGEDDIVRFEDNYGRS